MKSILEFLIKQHVKKINKTSLYELLDNLYKENECYSHYWGSIEACVIVQTHDKKALKNIKTTWTDNELLSDLGHKDDSYIIPLDWLLNDFAGQSSKLFDLCDYYVIPDKYQGDYFKFKDDWEEDKIDFDDLLKVE